MSPTIKWFPKCFVKRGHQSSSKKKKKTRGWTSVIVSYRPVPNPVFLRKVAQTVTLKRKWSHLWAEWCFFCSILTFCCCLWYDWPHDKRENWVNSYLQSSDSAFKLIEVTGWGVLQGSMLGPLIFSIYVLLLSQIMQKNGPHNCNYADDTSLCHRKLLSAHLDRLSLGTKNQTRDLGTIMTSDLNWAHLRDLPPCGLELPCVKVGSSSLWLIHPDHAITWASTSGNSMLRLGFSIILDRLRLQSKSLR